MTCCTLPQRVRSLSLGDEGAAAAAAAEGQRLHDEGNTTPAQKRRDEGGVLQPLQRTRSPEQRELHPLDDSTKITVRMIDFAHVFPLGEDEEGGDESYRCGLLNLIAVLEGISSGIRSPLVSGVLVCRSVASSRRVGGACLPVQCRCLGPVGKVVSIGLRPLDRADAA